MNRRDVVLRVLEEHQAAGGRAIHEAELLDRVHAAGDMNCTRQSLRMILRGFGDQVRCPVAGPLGMARWELAKGGAK